MSLILEALKKSEQQRRLGEAPNLGTPVLAVRRHRNLLPAFAALIVIALGAGWWLLRTPSVPVATDTPKTAVADKTPPKPAAANPPLPRSGKPATATDPARRDLANQAEPPSAAPRNDRTAVTAAAPRAPIPAPTRPLALPAPPATAAAPVATTAKPEAVKPANAAKPTVAATPAPSTATPATPASAVPKPAAPSATSTAAAVPAKPNLPTVWELPYATRKDIPEFALTMHVYAATPADRFVVIKGERHVEGDDLGEGLVLKEISADGMILDYKGQRFVYPRDGR